MILYIYCHLLIVILLQDDSLLILTFNFTNASWIERFSLDDIKGYRVTYFGALKNSTTCASYNLHSQIVFVEL